MAGVLEPGRFPTVAFRTLDWGIESGPSRLERMRPLLESLARMKGLGLDLNGQDGGGMGIVHRLTEYSTLPDSLVLLKELGCLGLEFDRPTRSGVQPALLCSNQPRSLPFREMLEIWSVKERLEKACPEPVTETAPPKSRL
jgi:hypothetical protein